MEKVGVFQVKESFQLTDRGLVAVGQIIEGIVKIGFLLPLEIQGKEVLLKIRSVEIGDIISKGEYLVGLVFSEENIPLDIDLKRVELKEQMVEIFKNEESS